MLYTLHVLLHTTVPVRKANYCPDQVLTITLRIHKEWLHEKIDKLMNYLFPLNLLLPNNTKHCIIFWSNYTVLIKIEIIVVFVRL